MIRYFFTLLMIIPLYYRHMKYRILKVFEVVVVAFTTTAVGFCAMYFVEDCTYAQVKDTELYNLQVGYLLFLRSW